MITYCAAFPTKAVFIPGSHKGLSVKVFTPVMDICFFNQIGALLLCPCLSISVCGSSEVFLRTFIVFCAGHVPDVVDMRPDTAVNASEQGHTRCPCGGWMVGTVRARSVLYSCLVGSVQINVGLDEAHTGY